MAQRTCLNCLYACCDPEAWLRRLCTGEPLVPRCANHPQWPGQLREVPGTPCRNYQPRLPEPAGEVRRIPLGDGHCALVDAADYEWLSRWTWRLHNGYAMRWENHREVYMHREIMRPPDGMVVDHINHQKADNRRSNLRVCTQLENVRSMGKKRGTASRFKGITRTKNRKKWYAQIRYGKQRPHLGPFEQEAEAARAYDRLAVQYFRDFAKLNFPQEWPPERRQEIYEKDPPPPAKRKPSSHTKPRGRKGRKQTKKSTRRTTQDAPRKRKKPLADPALSASRTGTPSRKGRKRKTKKAT